MIDCFPFIVPHWRSLVLALPAIPALGALLGSIGSGIAAAAPTIGAVGSAVAAGTGVVEGAQAAAAGRSQRRAANAEINALSNAPRGPLPVQSPVGSPSQSGPNTPSFLAAAAAPTQNQSGSATLLGA